MLKLGSRALGARALARTPAVGGWRRAGVARLGARCASSLPPNVQVVYMPALSPTMQSGKLTKWHMEVGASVSPGDTLCEIETDKATLDFEMQEDGFIAKLLIDPSDDDVAVGSPVALMVEEEDEVAAVSELDVSEWLQAQTGGAPAEAAPAPAEASPAPAPAPAAAAAAAAEPSALDATQAMPAARALIATHRLDVSAVRGTGKGGRITKGDVVRAMADGSARSVSGAGQSTAAPAPAPAPAPGPAARAPKTAAPSGPAPTPAPTNGRAVTDEKPSGVRKVIAKRLTESKTTVPHAYATQEVVLDALMAQRKRLAADGVKVSVNDLIVKACALSLRDLPGVNSFFDPATGDVRENAAVDVSVAVATEGGLITPIVTDAAAKGLSAISADAKDLAARARAGKLAPEEYQGGSFTISNLGMMGIDAFSAVINPPQACILAVSRGAPKLRVVGEPGAESLVRSTVMSVTMSSDARVVDDALAAEFLGKFRGYIEHPMRMLL